MSLLAVGLSHHGAAIPLLERVSLTEDAARALARRLARNSCIRETAVLATCNRLEVYAQVDAFHESLSTVAQELVSATGVSLEELTPAMYAHYGSDAVSHLFRVASGLDSMAVGESQIIGQVRHSLQAGQRDGTVGSAMTATLQHALRTGKRVHSETGVDRIGPAMVVSSLEFAREVVGPLEAARILVVGAGAMSGLAVATAVRMGAGRIQVANRTMERARRLAAGVGGTALDLRDRDALVKALGEVDVVISCTGAVGHVVDRDLVEAGRHAGAAGPQVFVDLALPRDVDPAVATLPGCHVLSLDELRTRLAAEPAGVELEAAQRVVAEEVAAWHAEMEQQTVVPTVVALRSYAGGVVEAELDRLMSRNPGMDPRVEAEVRQTVKRVADKLLHNPTVRLKSLAGSESGDYAQALRELFGLSIALDQPDSLDTAIRVVPSEKAARRA